MDRRQACKLFELSKGFTPSDLHAAYRSRIKGCHPDLGGDDDEAKAVIEAYGLLAGSMITDRLGLRRRSIRSPRARQGGMILTAANWRGHRRKPGRGGIGSHRRV